MYAFGLFHITLNNREKVALFPQSAKSVKKRQLFENTVQTGGICVLALTENVLQTGVFKFLSRCVDGTVIICVFRVTAPFSKFSITVRTSQSIKQTHLVDIYFVY